MAHTCTPEQLRQYRQRAGRARGARYHHVVEGKLVSTRQIAERLAMSMTTALDRTKRGPFPLTWAGLTESKTRREPPERSRSMSTVTKPQRLLRLPEVLERVALSKSTLYARVRDGSFPKPVHLGTLSAWVESEIDGWIAAQLAARAA